MCWLCVTEAPAPIPPNPESATLTQRPYSPKARTNLKPSPDICLPNSRLKSAYKGIKAYLHGESISSKQLPWLWYASLPSDVKDTADDEAEAKHSVNKRDADANENDPCDDDKV